MRQPKFGTALFSLLLLSAQCSAGEAYPPALQNLLSPGMKVVNSFSAPADMTGYIISMQGRLKVVYLNAAKTHVIEGVMHDASGVNLTAKQLAAFRSEHNRNEDWIELANTHWIAAGAGTPKSIVYVFTDPYCPFCKALWKASLPYQKVGLQLRWLLVSTLLPDGQVKAAAILQAAEPGEALARYAQGIESVETKRFVKPNSQSLAVLKANQALARKLGIYGTPALIFKDGSNAVQILVGMPKLGMLPEIFALPEQVQTDPMLANFR